MDRYHPSQVPDLGREINLWIGRNSSWYLRPQESCDEYVIDWIQTHRYATPEEIAEDLLNDPAVLDALRLLASPVGEAIEQAVAQLYIPASTAQLLTAGLERAWKIALDQNRPAWLRAEALTAAGIAVAVVAVATWTSRRHSR